MLDRAPVAAQSQSPDARLVTLGTGGGPLLRTERAQSANLLIFPEGLVAVDLGQGAISRLTQAGHRPDDIKAVLLTHHHIDHVADLWSFILHRWASRAEPMTIVGPTGTKDLVEGLLRASRPIVEASEALANGIRPIEASVEVLEMNDRNSRLALPGFPSVMVTAAENSHLAAGQAGLTNSAPVSLGYRIDTPSRSFLFTGDTGPSMELERLGQNVDVVIGEVVDVEAAMRAAEQSLKLPEAARRTLAQRMGTGHMTPAQLGALARVIGANTLVVSHITPSTAPPSDDEDERLTSDIARQFSGRIVVARDLMTF
jgi:ribonuclease BN (tRNA processing enzyme)